LKTKDTHGWRAAVFLAVVIAHAVLLLLVIRAARLITSPKRFYEPLVVMVLPNNASETQHAPTPPAQVFRPRPSKQEHPPDNAITIPPENPAQPQIDWEHETELAAENRIAQAEKEKNYRNLAGLSAEQLSWVRQNHMVPAPPGIEWTHPRFEFDRNTGLPMFWVNDHCVLITVLIFCGIGHIEPNGQLFKHMRDPHDP
jgi:hypothetical protein